MLLNLKALNESFEKKYDLKENETKQALNESAKLNEKFSDSMPDWLKKRLAYTIEYSDINTNRHYGRHYGGGRSQQADINKLDNKYPNQDVPTARRPRGVYGSSAVYSLGPQFLEAGVDLNKVDVIEAPVPAKVPRTTKNQRFIPIFAFANGQVWAKGINDREEAGYNAVPGYVGEPFNRIPNSEIIDSAVAYAYIDLSAKGATDKIKKQRAALKAELEAIPEISRGISGSTTYMDSDSKGRPIGQWVDRDKSGYLKINAARYVNVAKELAKNKKYKRLPYLIDECSEQLNYYKQQLTMVLDDIDFSDFDSSNSTLARLKDSIGKFNEANSYFSTMKSYLDSIEDISNIKGEYTTFADRALRSAEICYDKLKEIEKELGYLFKEVADW